MAKKATPASKIHATHKQSNKNKEQNSGVKNFDTAFFRKNEFALILLGALLLTIIVFFVFFRSSDQPDQKVSATTQESFQAFEKRITDLEKIVENTSAQGDNPNNPQNNSANDDVIKDLNNRLTRLETAFLVKFESMIERMETLERKKAQATPPPKKPAVKTAPTAAKKASPPAAQTPPVKKAVKKEKKAAMFHTVTKGETLYSISKKYKTTVPTLRKLNNLSEKDKIFPGNNIIIR